MLRYAIKSLLARRLRLALTAAAVVLGVAFVSGTMILTDTLNKTFDKLFASANAGTDVVVQGKPAFSVGVEQGGDSSQSRPPVPASVLPTVRAVDGVATAVPYIDGYAQIIRPDGKIVSTGGAPTLGQGWLGDTRLNPYHLVAGSAPSGPAQVAIDRDTARKQHLQVGDRIRVLVQSGQVPATISGLVRFADSSLAGATVTIFDEATAEKLLAVPGSYTEILVAARSGVSDTELRDRIRAVLPAEAVAITGKQAAENSANDLQKALSFFNVFLLVFAVVSVFVGSFIIFNTFTMLVAQRTRELALLRALGASRRQVTRSVLVEAVAVGLIGSTVGLALGALLAIGLRALLGGFGVDIPAEGLVFQVGTVIWAYATGTVVTVVAALTPARRAARIPPVAALSDDVALPAASLRRRGIVGGVVTAAGAALMGAGLFGGAGVQAVGLGAMLVFLGVASLSPFISRPVVRAVGAVLPRLAGTTGRLARENALRNPRRTSATASALMIGLALVAAVGVMSASIIKSAGGIIDRSVGADFILSTQQFTGFPQTVAAELTKVNGVEAVTQFRTGPAQLGGKVVTVQGATADTVDKTLRLNVTSGSLSAMADGGLLVDEKTAKANGWKVGQSVPVTFARTGPQELRIGGIYAENQIAGPYLIGLDTFARNFVANVDQVVAVTASPGADLKQVRAGVERAAEAVPSIVVRDQSEFKAEQRSQINQLLALVLVLLALAVVIAAMGIVNTLALSVIERTREIGLLRAVGMVRGQVRRMVTLESVVIAAFGTLLGLGLGVLYGWAIVSALSDEGLDQLAIPVGQLASYLVAGLVVGVIAAVWPARRAARLDVLKAVTTE